MRTWVQKHPIFLGLALALFALAATGAVIFHYLGSWLILPLI
jgi:hypothetical protein